MDNIKIQSFSDMIGTHKFSDILIQSFTGRDKIFFVILFLICFFISKKLGKKVFKINNVLFLILFITYGIISFIKAYYVSKLPPHNILKDFCGLKFDIVATVVIFILPLIYTLILLVIPLDRKIKNKKHSENEENKNEL